MRLCIHVHIHGLNLVPEFLYYLGTFPYPFDLYITTSKNNAREFLTNAFSACCNNAEKVIVIASENRGRDVAPWIIEMSKYQRDYDFVCHVHSKESPLAPDIGKGWRRYLLDNLISPQACATILEAFAQNDCLGCVFPAPFGPVAKIMSKGGRLLGCNELLMKNLLKRMNLNEEISIYNLLYSPGTMFWYRPDSLAPLFKLGLTYEDFPAEPIGADGTLAHAIERIINFVCIGCGYVARVCTPMRKNESPFSALG